MEFTLRSFQASDLENLVKYGNNFQIAKNLTNHFPHPYREEAGKSFIEMATKEDPTQIMVIDVDGAFCGAIGLHPQADIMCKNIELGYWLGEPFWSKGIMTNAVKRMVRYGFENFEVERIFARPFETNIGSQKVLEKAGFQLEARFEKTIYKNGEFLDELVYAIRRTA